MKKTSLLLCMVMTVLFIGCSKDEDNEMDLSNASESVAGTWNLKGYDVDNGTIHVEFEGETASSVFVVEGKDFDASVTFAEDKSFTSEGSFTTVISTTFEGETNIQEAPIANFLGEGTWSIDNEDFIFTVDGQEATYKIISLTESTMVIDYDLTFVQNTLGATVTTTGTYRHTLERQ